MIDVSQNKEQSGAMVQLMRQLADARRGLNATEQALSNSRIEAKAALESDIQARTELAQLRDLVRQATTGPLEDDSSMAAWVALRQLVVGDMGPHAFAVVTTDELEQLKKVRCDHLCDWCPPEAGV